MTRDDGNKLKIVTAGGERGVVGVHFPPGQGLLEAA